MVTSEEIAMSQKEWGEILDSAMRLFTCARCYAAPGQHCTTKGGRICHIHAVRVRNLVYRGHVIPPHAHPKGEGNRCHHCGYPCGPFKREGMEVDVEAGRGFIYAGERGWVPA